MTDRTQYPAGSILFEMHLEMHASTVRDQITFTHEKEFTQELAEIELHFNDKKIFFIFENGERKSLGGYVSDELLPHFKQIDQILFICMGAAMDDPQEAQIIPLTIV